MAPVECEKRKSPRNRTLSLTPSERKELSGRLLDASDEREFSLGNVFDRTILGDAGNVLPRLPSEMADLVIVDPPYNLFKNFGDLRFSSMSDANTKAIWIPGWENSYES